MAIRMKAFQHTGRAARRGLIWAVALAVAAGIGLTVGPAPVSAEKARLQTGKTLSGNYLAGRHAQARRDLSAAADFLGAALRKSPKAPDLLRRTFILLTVEGRVKEATDLARRLLALKPDSPVANLALAVDDFRRGRYAAVRKRLDGLSKNGLMKVVAPVLNAWSLVGEKKSVAALKVLKPGTKEKATQALHRLHSALINEILSRKDEAEKHYLAVSNSKDGRSIRVVQLLGALYERTGSPDKARALYETYLSAQPGFGLLDVALGRLKSGAKPKPEVVSARDGAAETLFDIASSLRQQNARETALVLGRLALYLKPRFPVMLILLGDLLESDDRLEPAMAVYSSIDRKSAFSWPARNRIASILDRLERTEEAIKHLRRMAREREKDAGPSINLADILRGHDRFADAVKAYDQAFERIPALEPRHWTLLYARGIALERSKQWPRAEADFLKALKLKPDQPYVLNYLGYSWIENGSNLERAQEMIRKAAKFRPNDGYIIDSLGWGQYKLGNFEKAVGHLERAVELRPQDPIINDHLGDAYWRVGRRREAVFQWERSLTLDAEEDLVAKIGQKLKNGLGEDTETAKKTPQ